MYIPLNTAAYSPNTLNEGSPRQANQTSGRGFFTAPSRSTSGKIVRSVSSTFADVWSQPRLFFNSLLPVEQQFVVNAMRFETSQLKSDVVKNNVLIQLNRISHDIAVRVAEALGMTAPEADDTYYHDNKTIGVSASGEPLLKLDGLKVGYLTTASSSGENAQAMKSALADLKVGMTVVAEHLGSDIDQTQRASSHPPPAWPIPTQLLRPATRPATPVRLSTLPVAHSRFYKMDTASVSPSLCSVPATTLLSARPLSKHLLPASTVPATCPQS